ncbi:MAG: T9SS type A sorting domain-containing protein, partial [candidate division Zixibacteria bacterium]|nr:T9SS type A sorting domain-containing protein [candidate division Zixibacteria bacterium]
DERISTSSCDGEYWGANYGDSLEISAPGVFMYTTDRQGTPGYSTGDYYDSFNGTSSACPTAAGVAALVRSANRDLTNAQARVILRTTCDQVGGYVYSPKSYELGYGRVNAHRAVLEAMRAGLNTSVDIDANMDGLPDDYLNSYGKENVGGYFGETYFGPHATILEHTYRDSYNYTGYPMNSWDAVLYSSDNDMITCVFNTPTDSVTIAYAASSSYGLSLEAYDSLGNLLQSVVGSGGTYRVSYLTVTSSAENIAYVVMHDHGGYFVIDDVMYAKPYGVRCFMIPTTDNPEITIAPTGGTFYFWAIIENNSSSLYNVDLETASIDPSGTYYPTNSWNNIPVGRYERQTYYASMYVPAGVVPGMWASRVTYGNFPFDTKGAYQHGLYKRSSLMQGDGEPFDISEFVVEGFLGKVAISDSRDPFVRPDIEDLQDVIPTEFALNGNYPNPFNPTTKINYQLPTTSVVSLDIYNILGQKVETLVDGEVSAGYHTVDWNASEYSSGVYFAKLSDGKKTVTHKMMLVK